ncbi:MAG: bifunctional oligoribonuclease/PAP phosphatase NrnA [Lentisphaeria bacterium]|nr:bifunctional oligoribonuclease/PAP phosphatase NrnA [Lentisphaeria bacterium]
MITRNLDIVYAADILRQLDNVLILTHVRPDGDALGSALGLAAMMRANMRRAQVLLPEALPEKYRSFAEQTGYLTEFPEDVAETFDAVIILDCASSERIGSGREGAFPREDISILNIDHHPGNSVQAEWSCVQPDAAATAEILVKIAQLIDWKLTPQAATLFLLGIITDTGCFRFSNTSPETLRTAAYLLENDAKESQIIDAVYFSTPRSQQLFAAEMIQNCTQLDFDGRFACAVIPEELCAKYQFNMRDGETLIESLREIRGVKIAALLYTANDGRVKISLRSKDPKTPVGPLARSLGGGGHEMAAGITMAGCDLPEAAAILRGEVSKLL